MLGEVVCAAKNEVALSPNAETTVQRLERTKKQFLAVVTDIDEALALLKKYPDIEKLTDLLRRI